MTPAKLQQLDRLVDRIAAQLGAGVEPQAVIDRLIADEGARYRFHNGTYELRMAGVGGGSTVGGRLVLESWMRGALGHIARGRP